MTVEVLLLINLGGLTLLAYLVAINAHGAARLALSYLVATLMLAGTVFVVVQYVNSGVDAQRQQELAAMAAEKQRIEQQLLAEQQRATQTVEDKGRTAMGEKVRGLAGRGNAMANKLLNMDLQDRSVDFDALVARAVATVKEIEQFKQEVESAAVESAPMFPEASQSLKDAVGVLKEAGYYYRQFYNSEDSDQEDLRGRVMRQKARAAGEQFQKSSGQVL